MLVLLPLAEGLFLGKRPFLWAEKQPAVRAGEGGGEKNMVFIFKKINSLWKTCEKK